MPIQLSLKQIECFLVVCEELNFRKAAGRLNMTQSPLTRQIQSLEYSLDVRLFERTNKSVAITEEGETFKRYAITIMNVVDEALERVNHGREEKRSGGRGAPPSAHIRDPRVKGLVDGRQTTIAQTRKIRSPASSRQKASSFKS